MASPTSIKLEDSLKGRVQALAKVRQRSAHWIMREAIAQYVEREERREALNQATLSVWEAYQNTGNHASAEEVEAWLKSWGTANVLPAPECHE